MRLWLSNKIASEWEMPSADIAVAFWKSRFATYALECWPLERALRAFITDPSDGLDSVFDESEYDATHEATRKAWPSKEEIKLDTFNGKGPRQ